MSINEQVIRWSEIRLPNPKGGSELLHWKVDGPFALRNYYRIEGTDDRIDLDLSHRNPDGTIDTCLHCGAKPLEARREVAWMPLVITALIGLGLAPFTFGVSALLVAYPLWFLWSGSPRVQVCGACHAEFVDFRQGPRP